MWACDPTVTNLLIRSYHVAGPLFTQALTTFFAGHCLLAGDKLWPADAYNAVIEDPIFDFIVVGAGSAGSVVANRLSAFPEWKVLLIEGGGDPTISTELPQLFYSNMNSETDWMYKTQPQDGACRGYKTKGCAWPRGKTLGGSSAINAMFYVRGCSEDFNEWEANGNTGWGYNDVLPYFKKSQNLTHNAEEHASYHGTGGYLTVENEDDISEYENIIIQGGVELGMKHNEDINGATQMGITKAYTTTRSGTRCSTARAFLTPIKERKNFYLLKNAHATKLLFKPETNIVEGVLLTQNGNEITVKATKEVIVSCGALNTPQLLMLSGIGPENHLKELGIEVKVNLPVGENLQDHLFMPIFYTAPGDSEYALPNIVQMFNQYIHDREGPLATMSPHRVINFLNTKDPDATCADIQNHYLVFPAGITNMLDFFEKHDFSDEIQQKFVEMNKDQLTIIAYTVLLNPRSTGKCLLNSTNPMDKPLLYANYFDDPEDMKTLINGVKQFALKLGDTKVFKEAGFKLDWLDIDACKTFDKQSDDYLDCISREMTLSLYHPTCTCKMGPTDDETAVVDPELRVKGVEGLRVIDGSIMPFIVRGNTNAACIMIGEKGADMVSQYWMEHTEL